MSDPRRWITSRSRGARRASPGRAAGADSEPRWHNARLEPPHPPTPSPARCGRGGGERSEPGVRGLRRSGTPDPDRGNGCGRGAGRRCTGDRRVPAQPCRGDACVARKPPLTPAATAAPPHPHRSAPTWPWVRGSRWPTASGTPYRRGNTSRPPLQRRPVSLDHQLFDGARFSYYPVSVVANESHSHFAVGRA